MFLDKKADVGFVKQGIFLYTDNPIYGLGNLQLYGLAVTNRSLLGFVAGMLSQVAIFVFYWLWEKPFLRKMYGNQESPSSTAETAGMLNWIDATGTCNAFSVAHVPILFLSSWHTGTLTWSSTRKCFFNDLEKKDMNQLHICVRQSHHVFYTLVLIRSQFYFD